MTAEKREPNAPALRYASGERVLVGDVVMQPVNSEDAEVAPVPGWTPIFLHEAFGKVTYVMRPESDEAHLVEFPQGCACIEWRRWPGNSSLSSQDGFLEADCLFFVCRG